MTPDAEGLRRVNLPKPRKNSERMMEVTSVEARLLEYKKE